MKKKNLIMILAIVLIAVAAAIVVIFFLGKGEEEPPGEEVQEEVPLPVVEAPLTYELEERSAVIAFPVGESIVVTEERPAEEEESSEAPEESTSEVQTEDPVTVVVTYHYAGLDDPLGRVAAYCTLLTREDFAFVPVDGERMETELPAFDQPEGVVQLVRPIVPAEGEAAEKSLFSLELAWTAENCSVTVSQIAGGIVVPKKPQPKPITLNGAVDYFRSLHPSELGLSGESMEEYQVFTVGGAVLVEGKPCLRINIYSTSETAGTNVFAGQYLVANDGLALYRIDETGALQQLELPEED